MVLLDAQTISYAEELSWIIKIQWGVIGFIAVSSSTMIGMLHRGITKRLDVIEGDIKTYGADISALKSEMKSVKEDVHDLRQWQGIHDERLQRIERHPALRP